VQDEGLGREETEMKKRSIITRVRIGQVWFYSQGNMVDIKNSIEDIKRSGKRIYFCHHVALIDGRPLVAIASLFAAGSERKRFLLLPKKPHTKVAVVDMKNLRKKVFAIAKAKLEKLGRRRSR